MCTAATYLTKDFYFGRTLDYEFSYAEEVVIVPRNFAFLFRKAGEAKTHYAMIGTAFVPDQFPLFYDAVNEKGLCMAGLNFVGNAAYREAKGKGKTGVAQFEFIPYILGKCASVDEAEAAIQNMSLLSEPYSKQLPAAELHWLIADKKRAITVESTADGIHIYENLAGVLTNNPPFPEQAFGLNKYMSLSPRDPKNTFSEKLPLTRYSRGMGTLGLPGDYTSPSRFVRAAFTKLNSVSGNGEEASVNQFFHILGSVEQVRGCCELNEKEYEITIYTSCCNAQKGIYYYTTYGNHSITAVDMRKENLDGDALVRYPYVTGEKITFLN
ncbi:MAG: choloylglycine hydrolase [Clostridiales bacterium]|nr:choloylglycine hydrolase [Clostridiales bacterium]